MEHKARILIASTLALFLSGGLVLAQSAESLGKLQTAVALTIAAPVETIEIVVSNNVLSVLRVNSAMNGSTHQGFASEAKVIGQSVTTAISNDADYADLVSIKVIYIYRTGLPAHDKIMDSVDFRKNSKGLFDLHIS